MHNLLPQFQRYRDKIPQFIAKLYHILEQPQYSDYISWHGNEIIIKNSKKLQEKVLPNFFRHKHLSSFVRQLNMYKFSKVTKVTKERGCMYFKNDHFKRGQIQDLTKINRNQRSNSGKDGKEGDKEEVESVNVSINKGAEENNQLTQYKDYVRNSINELIKILKVVEQAHPEVKREIADPLAKCNEILEIPNQGNINLSFLSFQEQNKNMLSTMKLLPSIEPMLFSSQCSFMQIN